MRASISIAKLQFIIAALHAGLKRLGSDS